MHLDAIILTTSDEFLLLLVTPVNAVYFAKMSTDVANSRGRFLGKEKSTW